MTATLDAALLSRHALVPLLGTTPPPATASRADAIRHYGHDTPIQQQRVAVWACWAALEQLAREVAEIDPKPVVVRARTMDTEGVPP
jgi:hypothetical protein